MINEIATSLLFGKPLIMYGGIFALLLMISTAMVGFLNLKNNQIIPFEWHSRLAIATLLVAFLHAFFGLSIFFNF